MHHAAELVDSNKPWMNATLHTPWYIKECDKPRGGGGGTLIFSVYVGSDPASTVYPQKISGISSTPKKYLNF